MLKVCKHIVYLLLVFLIYIPFWYVAFTILWPFQYFFMTRRYRGQTELRMLHDWVKSVRWQDLKEFIFE